MHGKWLGFSLGGSLLLGGCMSAQQARLYSMKDGSAASLVVDSPNARAGGVSGRLATGAACRGSYGPFDPADAPLFSSPETSTDRAVASVAVLSCDSGTVLRCTLARRGGEGFSNGDCRDQGGAQYSMVF